MVFKSKFSGWDDVIAVDFTRSASSVRRTGADLQKWMKTQEVKSDLTALFAPRQQPESEEWVVNLIEEFEEMMEGVPESFVIQNRKFVKLSDDEKGIFYSEDCYVYLVKYYVETELPESGTHSSSQNGDGNEEGEDEFEEELRYIVYFWQGRDASNMGWLNFTFTLQKK